MRRRSILLLSLGAALAAALLIAARSAVPLARPALGFVAKTICSNVFVGGMTPAQALDGLPDEPVARLIRTRIDRDARSVRASIPLIAAREAAQRDGLGCTLMPAVAVPSPSNADAAASVARGERPDAAGDDTVATAAGADARPVRLLALDSAALDAVVRDAFAEPDADLLRNTRAVVVMHRGRIVAERYAEGYGPETRFPGWSMTKSVTNALAGILTARGVLSLTDRDLRPEWRAPGDPRAAITLHDLLTMTSGLDFDENYAPTGAATRMLFDSPDAAAVATASNHAFPPGARWSYSSATTIIISAIMRDALGPEDYLMFPRAALFDPLGMESAVLEPDPAGTFVLSSFMHATARDWARFGQLFLDDGVRNGERIMPEGWVAYSVTAVPTAPLGQYGAHWWLNAGDATDRTQRLWPDLPDDVYFASGFEGQYIAIVPSHDLVVVRLGVTSDERAFSMGPLLRGLTGVVDDAADTAAAGAVPARYLPPVRALSAR